MQGGFLNPVISPQVNAVLQVIILVLLVAGMIVKGKKKFALHGKIMLVAIILNLLSFVLIMLPSLLMMEIIRAQPLHAVSIAVLIHSAAGLVALILGVWLVASWHLQTSLQNCFKNKKLMRLTSALKSSLPGRRTRLWLPPALPVVCVPSLPPIRP